MEQEKCLGLNMQLRGKHSKRNSSPCSSCTSWNTTNAIFVTEIAPCFPRNIKKNRIPVSRPRSPPFSDRGRPRPLVDSATPTIHSQVCGARASNTLAKHQVPCGRGRPMSITFAHQPTRASVGFLKIHRKPVLAHCG